MAEPELQRVKLIVHYNGNRFKGFQRQSSGNTELPSTPNQDAAEKQTKRRKVDLKPNQTTCTIQECMENSLERYSGLNRSQLRMRFAGRTDGGVHARGQVVVVSLPSSLVPFSADEWWTIRKGINSRLPDDISVEEAIVLLENPDFDPRKDAIRKQYSYTLKYRRKVWDAHGNLLPLCTGGPNCTRSGLDPKTMWISPWALDDSKIEHFCNILTGEHDYSAFVHKRARREQDNTMRVERMERTILEQTVEEAPILTVRFLVEAKGFRRSMVRNLIGFLVDLCRGQVDESVMETIWTGTDEASRHVHSAPPFGLCLEKVTYKEA